MREPERDSKSDVSSLAHGGGDLRRRIEEFGSRVRKTCIRRRNQSSSEFPLTDSNALEESKSNGITITQQFVDIMYFGTPEDQMRGVRFIRKLLSSPEPPIDEVMQGRLLPILVSLLKSQSDLMQYEAAWSLTNILTGNSQHVRYVIEAGAVESFVRLLYSSNVEVQELCAWALGNIAGDLDEFRAFVLERGGMFALLNMMENTIYLKLLQTGAWAVCNLCNSNPDFKSISPAIPVLGSFLSHDNLDFIYNCTSALVHLSEGKERIPIIVNNNIVEPVIKLLLSDKECLMPHLLKIITNVSLGAEEHIDCLMKCDVLSAILRHLESDRESYRYKATSIVANMALGNKKHIDYIVRNTFVINKIKDYIKKDSERIIRQAVYTLRNISKGGSEEQIVCITERPFIEMLCSALLIPNAPIILAALFSLENLLSLGEKKVEKEGAYNHVALMIEELGGLEKIEELQSHSNHDIYHKAYDIMENYFTTEEINSMGRPNF